MGGARDQILQKHQSEGDHHFYRNTRQREKRVYVRRETVVHVVIKGRREVWDQTIHPFLLALSLHCLVCSLTVLSLY